MDGCMDVRTYGQMYGRTDVQMDRKSPSDCSNPLPMLRGEG